MVAVRVHMCRYSDFVLVDQGDRYRGFKIVGMTVKCIECGQTVGTSEGADGSLSLFPHEDPRRA